MKKWLTVATYWGISSVVLSLGLWWLLVCWMRVGLDVASDEFLGMLLAKHMLLTAFPALGFAIGGGGVRSGLAWGVCLLLIGGAGIFDGWVALGASVVIGVGGGLAAWGFGDSTFLMVSRGE